MKNFEDRSTYNSPKAVVIEDENLIAEGFQIALEQAGYSVEVFNNGRDALNYFKENTAHLILLDLHLPEVMGDEIVKQLRMNPQLDDTRIFLATADSRLGIYNESNADVVLLKPIGFHTLKNLALRFKPNSPLLDAAHASKHSFEQNRTQSLNFSRI